MANQKCIICDTDDPTWPVVDFSTGFKFCDNCYREAKHKMIDQNFTNSMSIWLSAIADSRNTKICKT